MFKTVAQLKEFILWAKAQKIQQISVGKTVVVFSDYALAETVSNELDRQYSPSTPTEERDTSRTLTDDEPEMADDEDALLFHSSQ